MFRKLFGEQTTITSAKARKVASQFDWRWAARMLDALGRAEYDNACAPALTEYKKVRASAWAAAYIATFNRINEVKP